MAVRACHRFTREGDHRERAKELIRAHSSPGNWADYNVHLSSDGRTVLRILGPSRVILQRLRENGWEHEGEVESQAAEIPEVVG